MDAKIESVLLLEFYHHNSCWLGSMTLRPHNACEKISTLEPVTGLPKNYNKIHKLIFFPSLLNSEIDCVGLS